MFSVDETGKLLENIQNAELEERSAIHGMVFDADEEYLYSADMWENRVWCHRKVSSFFFIVCFGGSDVLWLGFSYVRSVMLSTRERSDLSETANRSGKLLK